MRVLVGMSGGVDSSLSAALLMEAGHEVLGVTLVLTSDKGPSCSSRDSIDIARQTADRLGIPHTISDLREEFLRLVILPFAQAYSQGLTPNPCIECNRLVKFPALMAQAASCGADRIATGHYARTSGNRLLRAADRKKDQSYVLYRIGPGTVGSLILPLGGMTKTETRSCALDMALPSAQREESQEICFIEGNDYASALADMALSADRPGPVLDITGRVIGTHQGIARYTIGQRKGLNFGHHEPLYVTRIDPAQNAIWVGQRDDAMRSQCMTEYPEWLIEPPCGEFRAGVKVRSMMEPAPATISAREDGALRIQFDTPQWAPAPGQSAVLYDGETVMGGGVIAQDSEDL